MFVRSNEEVITGVIAAELKFLIRTLAWVLAMRVCAITLLLIFISG